MPVLRDLTDYKSALGLVETTDKVVERPLCRRPGLEGEILSFEEMEEKLSSFIRKSREDSGLTRAEFASLVGLSTAVYGRYERAFSHLTVGRMIHLCELLGITPIEILFPAAPHLYGQSRDEADDRLKLTRLIDRLPHQTVRNLVQLVEQMTPAKEPDDARESKPRR